MKRESLNNGDGQQFHQYKQNGKKIPFHLKSLNTKRQRHVMLEIQILAWDRRKNVAELKRLVGSHDITEK
jgi:hypothetical protein